VFIDAPAVYPQEGYFALRLYRAAATRLQLVLERRIRHSTGTDMNIEESADVHCSEGRRHGFCDLVGETDYFFCCDCGGNGPRDPVTYHWNGNRYEP
jgi:hypothetical protein